eukprot:352428-Chlamydomonas_euryale.AAC.4
MVVASPRRAAHVGGLDGRQGGPQRGSEDADPATGVTADEPVFRKVCAPRACGTTPPGTDAPLQDATAHVTTAACGVGRRLWWESNRGDGKQHGAFDGPQKKRASATLLCIRCF